MTWVTPEVPLPPEEASEQPPPAGPEPDEESPLFEATIFEDAPDLLEDTNPSIPVRLPAGRVMDAIPLWRHLVGLAMVLAAAALALAAAGLVFLPSLNPTATPAGEVPPAVMPSPTATVVPQTDSPASVRATAAPTLAPEMVALFLSTPPYEVVDASGILRRQDNPFTIIPERARAEIIIYTVQSGDTITSIAERFGLEMDSIGWCNSYNVIFALRPGTELFIPPVDGVCHQVLVPESIAEVAARYNVEDAYTIINSEFNDVFGATPATVLPSGAVVFVPGGTSTYIDWQYNPVVERTGGSGEAGGGFISFAPGEPGSCGRQANPGHLGFGSQPLASYSWSRGFSSFHTGVDLSASTDTPVYAAATGRVIYAGWNNWGYGYLVVVAHGPFTTLYGHLNSINVGCGQMVSAGGVIGGVGSTGNSSGPHLHFEIRYNDVATDPAMYFAF